MEFITANGLMLCSFDGRITPRVLAHMLDYLEKFGLESATFKIGCVEQRISRDDILNY